MVERHDGCGFRQSVALHDEESELAPERLELRLERGGAADDAPELPAEESMNGAVMPPAPHPMSLGQAIRLTRLREQPFDVLAEDIENFRNADEHRYAPRRDLANDLRRT